MSSATEYGASGQASRTLAQKLDHLFETATPKDQKAPSHEDVAAAINIAAGERAISGAYIWQLRTGRKTNPTMKHLEALARYFGVSPAYFLDDEQTQRIDEQLALLQALKESDVRNIALRAHGLSDSSRQTLAGVVSHLRKLEGLQEDPHSQSGDA
ncbi:MULTISPECIES: helix-turn-helix domain-containing protein [unclassified Streptomyces]|uniref:helix-turn-helix domain-containing protein n=1 Tax=unclassified Streptomyces TaxID=2593676 RepID=UPI0022514EBD|nr:MULTISPECIES: helix-turn-helix transcriptional regulator [unclassified Streptomyces]MCX4881434.1 helix-turn-helix domain-containing protein [Streptomyces sp. NBC_00847]MCX5421464.1 helix-turn-helix domain-containing protein [Streptomyces sp. NBC_00078]